MAGNELTSLNVPLIVTQLGLQSSDTSTARDFNVRRMLERGYSHLQAHYVSEWYIQTTNYPGNRTSIVPRTTKVKENPFINDDPGQIDLDKGNGLTNAPKQWRAK